MQEKMTDLSNLSLNAISFRIDTYCPKGGDDKKILVGEFTLGMSVMLDNTNEKFIDLLKTDMRYQIEQALMALTLKHIAKPQPKPTVEIDGLECDIYVSPRSERPLLIVHPKLYASYIQQWMIQGKLRF